MGKTRRTIRKYLEGDPDNLCRSNRHAGSLNEYDDYIIKCIKDGDTQSAIARKLKESGYSGTISNARQYICSLAKKHHLELSKYCSTFSDNNKQRQKILKADHITRKLIFNYLWMNGNLSPIHHEYLWIKYPVLQELEKCIRQFREFFNKKSQTRLYLFIDRYRNSSIKELATFANGLERDLEAVENAVSSQLSNGFVEGNNSKVKTIKKSMYGRCGITLLSAKLMYEKPTYY